MKSYEDIKKIISEVECKPWVFRFACIHCVRQHKEINDEFVCTSVNHVWYLQAMLFRTDTDSDELSWGYGGKYFITPHMTDGEIVKKCFVAARDYAEHEVREAFMWRGRRILGPHIDINALWHTAEIVEIRS